MRSAAGPRLLLVLMLIMPMSASAQGSATSAQALQAGTAAEGGHPGDAAADEPLLTRPWASTAGAMALGVLGLWWIRRRNAYRP